MNVEHGRMDWRPDHESVSGNGHGDAKGVACSPMRHRELLLLRPDLPRAHEGVRHTRVRATLGIPCTRRPDDSRVSGDRYGVAEPVGCRPV